ncbi:enoyl-CoA hydratase/isomerase family protein [Desulfococcus multivorans]|jgi:cyclohexa-1,5-dienecarbonyl-CoA hydratase|uniref:Enoyl-CoA hydratase/isomerase n=1 Tax=Desulfococcus multivorans DSM 2059 TaxID=1121405 RepID=S7U6P3_DESML|nr:enoyl-CoA hydratase/isomerase family protein [Desulfococcus multivorans]AOY59265.1 Dch: enoyl-CoA hydratase/isomerase related to dienoyl-CoA hydratase [Desulfococcus multivorans]AQV01487.1 enoyl-CoA hydratase [Desulfococcus multivorans]EPR45027.1 Enoyl-CoA hydratase/isomerase [Desulfococcus multivorans DSM 2059]MDX9817964.1 enoyl-CoA hydratase/isomerase family protein [Desulfococcus multivorans]SKA26784.1 cyclohexa-1,5-dienecarbonyl-CoA hydratase [Desulfococcus multivorans DSM 2059]
MTLNYLKLEKTEGVATVKLARPKHNVLDIAMMRELNTVLKQLADDAALKCLVLSGEGPSWCAGVEVGDHKPELVDDMIQTFNGIFENLDRIEVPTIAAVHGACLGGGMEVAIACDLIVASEKAVFGQPEIKLGFFPPYAAFRLPQLVGPAKAIEICTTGRRYTAAQAFAMGLVSQLAAPENFEADLNTLIGEIRYNSPLILRLNKKAVKAHLGMDMARGIAGVSDLFLNTLMKTEDTLEGIKSFEEKRKPEWKNR